jgi:hypothetical protein
MGTLTECAAGGHPPLTSAAAISEARLAQRDADRWTNEGGRAAAEGSPHPRGES